MVKIGAELPKLSAKNGYPFFGPPSMAEIRDWFSIKWFIFCGVGQSQGAEFF